MEGLGRNGQGEAIWGGRNRQGVGIAGEHEDKNTHLAAAAPASLYCTRGIFQIVLLSIFQHRSPLPSTLSH
jgi:hypothetical protein